MTDRRETFDTNDAESRDLRAFTLARELQMGLTDKGYIEEAAQTIEWQRLEIERLLKRISDLEEETKMLDGRAHCGVWMSRMFVCHQCDHQEYMGNG